MALVIRFQGGARAGEVVRFDDDREQIVLGRDPDRCDVVFPSDEVKVGREHCGLRRELGRYHLVLNRDNLVTVDGEPAMDEQELGPAADLQLGPEGPKLVVETVQHDQLPSTQRQAGQEGQATRIRASETSARSNRRLALVAVCLIAVAAAIGYRMWRSTGQDLAEARTEAAQTREEVGRIAPEVERTREEVERTREEVERIAPQVEQVRERVELIEPRVTALSAQNVEQIAELKAMSGRFDQLETKLEQQEPDLAAAVAGLAESVYLVLSRYDDGRESTQATAWVVDQGQGLLATNAHVAELVRWAGSDEQVLVRSNQSPPKSFRVKSVLIHPGYYAFSDLWSQFDPSLRVSRAVAGSIDKAGPACDVALLYLEDPTGLAEAIPLAPDNVLQELGAGQAVGSVGYPMEGLALKGVNPAAPAPIQHLAYITTVTNYFGDDDAPFPSRHLVQHAVPTIGGSSGSPILNAAGQAIAVHSGGNVIGSTGSARVKSPANINFAQRIDLVRELLDGTYEKKHADRLQQWKADIDKYFEPRDLIAKEVAVARRELVTARVKGWTEGLTDDGNYAVDRAPIQEATITANEPTPPEVELTEEGPCLAVAYESFQDASLEMKVCPENADCMSSQALLFRWARHHAFFGHKGTKLRAEVDIWGGARADRKIELFLYQATRRQISVDERRTALVNQWTAEVADQRGFSVTAELVAENEGELPDLTASLNLSLTKLEFDLDQAGDYFVFVAATEEGKAINMNVTGHDGTDLYRLCRYTMNYPTAYGSFNLPEARQANVVLTGAEDGIPYEVRIYRIVDAPPA